MICFQYPTLILDIGMLILKGYNKSKCLITEKSRFTMKMVLIGKCHVQYSNRHRLTSNYCFRTLNADRARSARTATRRRRRYGEETGPGSRCATPADCTTSYTGYVARQIHLLSCNKMRQPRY